MNVLAFDTCLGGVSVAVRWQGARGEWLFCDRFELREGGHAERLMPMIAEAMEEAGLAFWDLARIAVTVGPGTFTGTRIGVAAARALALASNTKTVGVSSLAVMAKVARREIASEAVAVVVDARRGEVYAQLFGVGDALSAKSPPELLSIDEAAQLGGVGSIVFVGSGAASVAAAASRDGRHADARLPDLLPDAIALAQIAATLEPSEAPLVPFYLRPPDAKVQDGKAIARA
jgi:tRNA threonylcarbamoyladenosine biosynthesis protein TsaB